MARKSSPTILQEELYPSSDEPAREELDDARLVDLDLDDESPFLRGQKRISVRRASLPKKAATRLKWSLLALVTLCLGGAAAAALHRYGEHSWRFRIESSDNIELSGIHNVTRSQVMEVMGGDIGRNIFFVPLAQRKAQLEQIPWVESASVMRFVPNRLRIEIQERTPVAFARIGPRISLIDAGGTLMELPGVGKKKYSFPVILGMNPGEPLSTRAARMKTYNELIRDLDSGGGHYSQDLSEVDLTDPDDVKVMASDPSGGVLVHLGSSNFLDRYRIYGSHVQEWRQQFDKLESVDLRYDRQIIVNPDLHGAVKQPPLSASAAKAARVAGVKPAALINHEMVPGRTHRQPAGPKPVRKRSLKPAARKKASHLAHAKRPAVETPSKTSAPAAKTAATPSPLPAAKGAVANPAPVPAATGTANPTVPPKPGNDAAKKKPSPAIAKGQEHP